MTEIRSQRLAAHHIRRIEVELRDLTLVISDGQPDDEKAALAEAERVTGRIDVLYVGPDGDRAAMDFLRRLARAGCGEFRSNDLAKAGQPALASTIGQLLLEHRR